MTAWPRTLYGRLVGILVVLMVSVSAFFVALTISATRLHLQEIDQTLNRDLATNIVHDNWLSPSESRDRGNFERSFDRLMAVNPAIELYLLDPEGRILRYSAPAGRVKRTAVSLAPVVKFLDRSRAPPILGDDPRDADGEKIFSAAPINDGTRLIGYLYAILDGEQYDSALHMVESSYLLRLTLGTMIGGVVLALAAGFLSFGLLTRRLGSLRAAVDQFNAADPHRPFGASDWIVREPGDEIDHLAATFARMARRIADQLTQLEGAAVARRALVASISHDLRTPLAALQGYVETVLMKEGTLSEEQRRQYLQLALQNSQKLGHLVEELFELSTLDGDERPLNVETFSLGELVQDVAQKFALRAREREVELRTAIESGAALVDGDIGLIERALDNLIDNAIKFTQPRGVVVVSVTAEAGRTIVKVSDTGRGIPAAHHADIFKPFYRVDRGGREAVEGAGLGLAIAWRIVELHGATIAVESIPGQGTTFSFWLAPAHA